MLYALRPGVFFPETAFCGVWRDRAGYGENSSGLKTRFFLANPSPARKILTFFSPTLPRRGKFKIFPRHGGELAHFCVFWRGICTFGENLYVLARRDMPRRGKFWLFSSPTLPRRGKFWLFSRHPFPGEENLRFFLAGVFPRHKYLLPDDP